MFENEYISVIIAAAGKGSRMKKSINKQFLLLDDEAVLTKTFKRFDQSEMIDEIIIVINPFDEELIGQLFNNYTYKTQVKFVHGGNSRMDSIYKGILSLNEKSDIVLVHDGARPFVTEELIENTIINAARHRATICAVPSKDTIKVADDKHITQTLKRKMLWNAQTPQAFDKKLLVEAYDNAKEKSYKGTDDASLVEYLGYTVHITRGDYKNFKITTPQDLEYARFLMKRENVIKIGQGYDVHQLVPGEKLILGGVPIDYSLGLKGHSDADVLLHAIKDALLGAAGLGDIGCLFPDSDKQYAGISSLLLLKKVDDKIKSLGFRIGNIDATIIAQQPKMAPHVDKMRNNISEVLQLSKELVNIKATTTENLGFVGKKEGIAAQAVCLIKK